MPTRLKKWTRISRKEIFKNKYFQLYHDVPPLSDGRRYDYFVNNPHGRVAIVLPYDERGNILVLREYRYPVGRIIYGTVDGSVDRGERRWRQ